MGGQPRGGHGVKLRRGCLLFSFKQETSYLLTTFERHQIAAGRCVKGNLTGMRGQGFAPWVHHRDIKDTGTRL